MGIKQQKIAVNDLAIGMFVSGLDRPWTQTPFPLQGFYIRDLDEIKELKIHCHHVYIDVSKGSAPAKITLRQFKAGNGKRPQGKKTTSVGAVAVDTPPIKVRRDLYKVSKPVEKEIAAAKHLHRQVSRAIDAVLRQIDQGDHQVSAIQQTKVVASQMVDSILRSPDAFTWLSRVKQRDQHTYSHSLRSAVWAILFGRHIGLPKKDLDVLALGVLLKDVGKIRLPQALLENRRAGLDEEKYQMFVEYGVEILRKFHDVPPRVISVVKTHCERIDGSGFPEQLQGNKIPLLGKIAGLVSYYDEIVNQRGRIEPLPPSKAVAQLYELRGNKFQQDLVVEFIRAIGLYPTGTVVELSSGEVGVVVEQNFARRLKPVVLVVIDVDQSVLKKPYLLDMAAEEKAFDNGGNGSKRHGNIDPKLTQIVRDVPAGVYDINVTDVLDEYISQRQVKSLFGKLLFKKFSAG